MIRRNPYLHSRPIDLVSRPGNQAMEDTVLYPLSYTRKCPGGGTRTRNLSIRSRRNPRLRIRPTQNVKEQNSRIGIVGWLRGHGSNADLLVQSQAWYQFHHLAWVWTERLELPTPGFRRRCASRCATSRWVLTAGVEPALSRFSTLCLYRGWAT